MSKEKKHLSLPRNYKFCNEALNAKTIGGVVSFLLSTASPGGGFEPLCIEGAGGI